eukprot:Platyproteum_vivax@DN499_c0_g1_i1.p1
MISDPLNLSFQEPKGKLMHFNSPSEDKENFHDFCYHQMKEFETNFTDRGQLRGLSRGLYDLKSLSYPSLATTTYTRHECSGSLNAVAEVRVPDLDEENVSASDSSDGATGTIEKLERMCTNREQKCQLLEGKVAELTDELQSTKSFIHGIIVENEELSIAHNQLQRRMMTLLERCVCDWDSTPGSPSSLTSLSVQTEEQESTPTGSWLQTLITLPFLPAYWLIRGVWSLSNQALRSFHRCWFGHHNSTFPPACPQA